MLGRTVFASVALVDNHRLENVDRRPELDMRKHQLLPLFVGELLHEVLFEAFVIHHEELRHPGFIEQMPCPAVFVVDDYGVYLIAAPLLYLARPVDFQRRRRDDKARERALSNHSRDALRRLSKSRFIAYYRVRMLKTVRHALLLIMI